jgi:large subunit ribosomal protein L15
MFKKVYTEVKLSDLECFENGTEVSAELLKEKGIISKINEGIVVLGNGNLTKKLTVKAARFTKSASEKIEALGGKAEVI